MDTKFEIPQSGSRIVYVKSVSSASLPDEIREKTGELETLYSVHNSEGEQLALVADRKLAFVLARQYDMVPVTAH